jgi:hypothetical protein
MPERLDRVTVSLNRDDVILTWDTRQALMRRLQHVQEPARLRETFEAVGASQPVELTGGQRNALLLTLEGWSLDLDGHEAMPQGLFELRNALIKELHDAGERQVNQ